MVCLDINIYIDKVEFLVIENIDGYEKNINKEKIIIPKSFNLAEQLKYIRKIMSIMIQQYTVSNASINIQESMGVEIINMIKMEGVIEELLASYEVERWK